LDKLETRVFTPVFNLTTCIYLIFLLYLKYIIKYVIMGEPSLFLRGWDKQKPKNTVEDNFFDNFQIKAEDKIYYFLPWNTEQKEQIEKCVDSIKQSLAQYSEESKKIRYARFPYKNIKEKIQRLLSYFFSIANLPDSSVGFDAEKEMKTQKDKNPENVEEQQKKKERFLQQVEWENVPDKKLEEGIKKLAKTLSEPQTEKRLEENVNSIRREIKTEVQKKIIKTVFNKYFPDYENNDKNNKKPIIVRQIKKFIETIENSLNQII